MTINWDNASFIGGLSDALEQIDEITLDRGRELAEAATAKMRATVPVESGATRKSIQYRTQRDAEGRYVVFGPTHYVARFIEYGTSSQPARPFIRPAIEQAIAEVFG